MDNDTGERLVPIFIPSLVSILLREERAKRSPLTCDEVVQIRGKAVCIMMAESRVSALTISRGYRDIDPEKCWEEWVVMREELT